MTENASLTLETVVVKDGPRWLKQTWEVDTSKPKIWLEGHFYQFNKRLLYAEEVVNPV